MQPTTSSVLQTPAPLPSDSAAYMQAKLAFHTDAWDVAEDLKAGVDEIVVVDTRAHGHYLAGHIPGAISFPHRTIDAQSTAGLDRKKTYVTYCDGIGCNGSTQRAYKLAALGFKVKEMLGGVDFWLRDGHPLVNGEAAGGLAPNLPPSSCGCA
ncbi:rhodanese-like domain-containing protein [Chitinimonas sp. BJB300]|uniref:rhodanese-like domain-containing protein n=1 Tax=Chitinimonas sp. BJB300 TaxID=1559339 RepID=UPI000C10ED61|nr:rhodanese-like domain-containing protein [Chitinimonas sp. BJB300]PHV10678.1 rhodanese [Chitinimonas sp. BJB300]TSJ84488.1 rhodanese [Chitinimonas sp. BJB300]